MNGALCELEGDVVQVPPCDVLLSGGGIAELEVRTGSWTRHVIREKAVKCGQHLALPFGFVLVSFSFGFLVLFLFFLLLFFRFPRPWGCLVLIYVRCSPLLFPPLRASFWCFFLLDFPFELFFGWSLEVKQYGGMRVPKQDIFTMDRIFLNTWPRTCGYCEVALHVLSFCCLGVLSLSLFPTIMEVDRLFQEERSVVFQSSPTFQSVAMIVGKAGSVAPF